MPFADQVRDAIAAAEGAADTEPAQRYRAVLEELATGLRRLGVGARIHPGRDPRRLTLQMYPQHRPARASIMLSFILDGDDIMVVGENTVRIHDPDELQRWLLDFVRLPNFIESLRTLREEANLPVEARLRVDVRMPYARGDVVVAVSPADQERLANAAPGSTVELEVERIEFPGNAPFADPAHYAILDSAGLLVEVQKADPSGGKLRITGRRAAPV